MSWLETIWAWFVASQLICFAISLVFLCWIVWREYQKGNDLTYQELGRLVFSCAMISIMGVFLPLFVWVMSRTGEVEISYPGLYQKDSIYECANNERVLLRGSQSAKTFRALTEEWE